VNIGCLSRQSGTEELLDKFSYAQTAGVSDYEEVVLSTIRRVGRYQRRRVLDSDDRLCARGMQRDIDVRRLLRLNSQRSLKAKRVSASAMIVLAFVKKV
jgi:hypothetical protein